MRARRCLAARHEADKEASPPGQQCKTLQMFKVLTARAPVMSEAHVGGLHCQARAVRLVAGVCWTSSVRRYALCMHRTPTALCLSAPNTRWTDPSVAPCSNTYVSCCSNVDSDLR